MSEKPLTGQCLCGSIRYKLERPLSRVNSCHCVQCKRQTGAAFATWVTLPVGQATFEGNPVTYFRSSEFAERGFCRDCGSALVWRRIDGDLIDLSVGTLDDANAVSPDDHYWAKDMAAWLHMDDGLPRHYTAPKKT